MLYLLYTLLRQRLEGTPFGFLRVFTFAEFQATASVAVSFLVVVVLGGPVIRWLRKQKIGDLASFDQKEFDQLMASKKGTPTMGGVLILSAIVATTVLLADLRNFYIQMGVLCVVLLGAVGMVDDWLKLTAGRRAGSRDGLKSHEKLVFQIGFAAILSYFTFRYGSAIPGRNDFYLPFVKEFSIPLSMPVFVVIGVFVMTGFSNAVNLTDGLDGLAAGSIGFVSFVLLTFCLIVGDRAMSVALLFKYMQGADQMAVMAGAMAGACLGFLWFNCNPARVFMGDTGSLAMGGLIGYIATVTRQELILGIAGGVFCLEALSVMIQVGYFKLSRRMFGTPRRVFLMAPLHHHFQKKGWTENQVVVRFWLIGAICAAAAVATIKLR